MIEEFFEQQLREWPMAAANYRALGKALFRNYDPDGLDIRIKCIPQRLRSVAADTSKAGIAARACFLCSNQLPAEQKSINICYENQLIRTTEQAEAQGFRILVNPYPAFSRHFTIAAVSHREQSLRKELPAMISLAAFMPDYLLFYNAAGAGASAPDHLHFQACPKGSLPVERNFASIFSSNSESLFNTAHSRVYSLKNFLRKGWLLQSTDQQELCFLLQEVLTLLAPAQQAPLVNLLSWYQDGTWTCLLFPRSKHRPDCYFKTGAEQIMISPASVEMGGLIVLVRPEDFEKVSPELVSRVYAEVSLSSQTTQAISEQWKALHTLIKPQKS